MLKTRNKTAIAWIALVLVLLFILPTPAALALEGSPSVAPENSLQQDSFESQENSSQTEEEELSSDSSLEGQVSEEESLIDEESSSQEESSSSETSGEEESSSQPEESSALEDTESPELYAYPLLRVGGHEAYMSGESGARFYPGRNMTRAEMAQTLYNLLAKYPPVSENHFKDVNSGDWYAKPVNTLVELEILSGYEDGTFRPSQPVTRAEFVAALCKCFEMTEGSGTFPDVQGHWAENYINFAVSQEWITGFEDGTFRPDDKILRCQVTAILNSALELTGEGFAADRDTQEFVDVPTDHWAFLHPASRCFPHWSLSAKYPWKAK